MILGAVLAGGQSSRFGSDKALAELDGRTLLARAVEALQAQCDAVVVVGREDAPVPTLPDRPRPGMGPLGGIAAALHHAAGRLRRRADLPGRCGGAGRHRGRRSCSFARLLRGPAGDRPVAGQRPLAARCDAGGHRRIRCAPLPGGSARGPCNSLSFLLISIHRRISPSAERRSHGL
jgi:hypothetical protein